MSQDRLVAEPIKIDRLQFRNRIFAGPLSLRHEGLGGNVSEKLLDFHERRAKGGASLVMVGGAVVETSGAQYDNQLRVNGDQNLAGLSQISRRIRDHGAIAGLQLFHAGRWGLGEQLVSPSPIPFYNRNGAFITPPEASHAEIAQLKMMYCGAAIGAVFAGYQVVELDGSNGYLLGQFASSRTNKRSDGYGGSIENRSRLACELLQAMAQLTGGDLVLGYRMTGDELLPDGFKLEEAVEMARHLEEAGAHYITITEGSVESFLVEDTVFGYRTGPDRIQRMAAAVKKAISIPVVTGGGARTPDDIEEILQSGSADAVALARPLFADPDLPAKIISRKPEPVRTCIRCGMCLDDALVEVASVCTVDPQSKAESYVASAPVPHRVAVIGGGPAGLNASIAAASRGHEVTLFEKSGLLGGQVRLASGVPGKSVFMEQIQYLEDQAEIAGVKILTNSEFKIEEHPPDRWDAVILAAGGNRTTRPLPGPDSSIWYTLDEILNDAVDARSPVAVIGGLRVAGEVADKLLIRNKSVLIVERRYVILPDWDARVNGKFLKNRLERRTEIHIGTTALATTEDGLMVRTPEGEEKVLPAASFVSTLDFRQDRELESRLRQTYDRVRVVGDALNRASLREAIHTGYQAGLSV